jgi:uncharacterized protein YggE
MNIPENFKKAWLWLVTIIMVVAILLGLRLMHRDRDDASMPSTITVNGKGEIQATPNISKFSATVEETAKDQKTALDQTSSKVNAIIAALKGLGIEDRDIKTEYTNINPNYEYQSADRGGAEIMIYPPVPGKQVITGYVSAHTLSVKVRNLEKVSDVQKVFADNKIQNVSGPELSIDEPEKLQLDARAKAIDDAKSQAEILAKQLHVRLGNIVSFSDTNNGAYPMYMSARAEMAMDKAASAPEANIAPGEQTISSNVSITYKIR